MAEVAFDLVASLVCPVCFELPAGEVHQCFEGHCYCVDCWRRLDPRRCPECRDPIPLRNRCRAQEARVAALPAICDHCDHTTTRGAMAEHLRACQQRPTTCTAAAKGLLIDGRWWDSMVLGEKPLALDEESLAGAARPPPLPPPHRVPAGRVRALDQEEEEEEGGRRRSPPRSTTSRPWTPTRRRPTPTARAPSTTSRPSRTSGASSRPLGRGRHRDSPRPPHHVHRAEAAEEAVVRADAFNTHVAARRRRSAAATSHRQGVQR